MGGVGADIHDFLPFLQLPGEKGIVFTSLFI